MRDIPPPLIVTLPAPTPTETSPAPEKTSPVLNVPVELLVVFPVALIETEAAAADGTEIVTLLLLTPTLATPAPENTSALLNVPLLLEVVFPTAETETVLKFVTLGVVAETVILLLLIPTETMPAPDTLRTLLNVPDDEFVVFPTPDSEMVEKFVTDGVVAEIVIEPAPAPTLTMPAPEIVKAFE